MGPENVPQNDASLRFDLPAELKQQIAHAAAMADMNIGQWLRAVARERIARNTKQADR